jgi:hypothetical protein
MEETWIYLPLFLTNYLLHGFPSSKHQVERHKVDVADIM